MLYIYFCRPACLCFLAAFFKYKNVQFLRKHPGLVIASDCQCTSCNGPGFDPSMRRHNGIWGAVRWISVEYGTKKKSPKKYYKKKIYFVPVWRCCGWRRRTLSCWRCGARPWRASWRRPWRPSSSRQAWNKTRLNKNPAQWVFWFFYIQYLPRTDIFRVSFSYNWKEYVYASALIFIQYRYFFLFEYSSLLQWVHNLLFFW